MITKLAAPARRSRRALIAVAAAALALVSVVARGDDDLPGRVGRVADFGGEVFSSPEEQASDWTAIGLNQPVTTGDNLWVAANGRAEIDYGGGQLRIGGDSNVHVLRLDDREIALFVAQGRVIVRVRVLDTGDVAYVDTPNTQLQLLRPGLYRVDVDPASETTTLVVREGEATVALASSVQQTLPGQTAVVSGTGATDADIRSDAGVDGFDTWSATRDRYYERSRSASYVSREMVGYADLDSYGMWEASPTYGPVWYPSVVVADWAPYRFGHWTWVRGFGYAWVDDAPWGYAPFHYGRWVHDGGRWGWCPGHYVARPAWAPALVAWYGGAGWSLSASYGSPVYGWVPLAWGEAYHPWWNRCSDRCWGRYNRPYAVNVAVRAQRPPATYANMRVPGAVTAVPGTALAGARPVAASRVPIQSASPPPALAAAPPIQPLAVGVPTVRPGNRGAPPPASTLYRAGAQRSAPAPTYASPSPFSGGQAAPAPASPRVSEPRTTESRNRAPALPSTALQPAPQSSAPAAPRAPQVVPAPPSAPAMAPQVIDRQRQVPRPDGTPTPQPSPRGVAPAAPPQAPAPRAVAPAAPPPAVLPQAPPSRAVAPPAPPPRVVAPPAPPPRVVAPPAPPPRVVAPPAPPLPQAPAPRGIAPAAPPAPPPPAQVSSPRGGDHPGAAPQPQDRQNASPRGGPQQDAPR